MAAKLEFRRRGIWTVVLLAVLMLAVLSIWHESLLARYGRWLVIDDQDLAADAVVVLGGHSGFRVKRGAELVLSGRAGRLAMTAEPAEFPAYEEPSVGRWLALAESLGVEPDVTDVLMPSHSTFDDAWLARRYAEARGFERLAFVTDPFHTRRAHWVVSRIFAGSDIEIAMAASDLPWFTADTWWKDERPFLAVVLEYVKLAYYAYAYGLTGDIGDEPAGFHVRPGGDAAP